MRTRIVLAAALATGALVASSAQAARAPQITDPKGDAVTSQANHDILSVTLDTPRTGKSKTSPIKTFSVEMVLAGAPKIEPGVSYQVTADMGDCGTLYVFSYWSAANAGPTHSMQISDCGTNDSPTDPVGMSVDPTVKIAGNSISWSVSGKALPKEIKPGYAFATLFGYTAVTEGVYGGYSTADFVPASAIDATESITYKYGS